MSAISGMTGFGRADGAAEDWTWSVEARSVNGRNLEVRFRGPPGFDSLERHAKSAAQARLSRGQVTLGIQAKRADPGAGGVLEAPELVDDPEAHAAVEAAMAASIDQALDALKLSRDREGEQLEPVVTDFIDRIATLVDQAEAGATAQTDAIRERFARRMTELAPDAPGLEDRIYLEAASLATKADVREELDRLTAHVASARTLLQQPPAGRKLDFLMQEFMREANTLCSKSATTALTGIGLELKAVIEQLREQVQNVE